MKRTGSDVFGKMGSRVVLFGGFAWLYQMMYGQPAVLYKVGFTAAALFGILAALGVLIYLAVVVTEITEWVSKSIRTMI